MVTKVGQKNKGYELWTEKSEDSHGELKVFIRMTGADDAMNEERKVVRVAVVVICSSIVLSILFSQISLGLLTLVSSVYAAPALVSAIYGAIAIYKLNKTCIEQS